MDLHIRVGEIRMPSQCGVDAPCREKERGQARLKPKQQREAADKLDKHRHDPREFRQRYSQAREIHRRLAWSGQLAKPTPDEIGAQYAPDQRTEILRGTT